MTSARKYKNLPLIFCSHFPRLIVFIEASRVSTSIREKSGNQSLRLNIIRIISNLILFEEM
jgi:hypothetical protein